MDTDDSDELSSNGLVKCESELINNDLSEYKQLLGEYSQTGTEMDKFMKCHCWE